VSAGDPCSATVTVAIMKGCTVQRYANVPASSNVNEKLCPLLKMPLSHSPDAVGDTPDVDV
jgi:hypothetical protein